MTPNETPTPLTDAAFAHHQDFPHDDEGGPWLLASNLERRNAELVAALSDMLSGWRYIRATHGDLYGVGWDRAQTKAEQALAAQEGGEG